LFAENYAARLAVVKEPFLRKERFEHLHVAEADVRRVV
jgi:hypothetical protein